MSAIKLGAGNLYGPFLEALAQLGWVEGQNLIIERYSANGDGSQYDLLAETIVRSGPDLIYTQGGPLILSLKTKTDTFPIVGGGFGGRVIRNFVESLARPGGNVTGLTLTLGASYAQRECCCASMLCPRPPASGISIVTI